VPCLRLSYDRAEDAAALLRDTFEGALPEFDAEPPAETSSGKKTRPTKPLANDAMIHRRPGAEARERGGQAFLTDAEEAVILHLNATGTALWHLLEQPTPFGEITAVFAAGFPERDPVALVSDLSRLIRDLATNGLVRIEVR
jgi:hypothetical protein